ncbi:unnamed protein product [Caenorhabditis angaria]|uniref:Uncharacterized protein n=1 Tax=Caenorhabditis angaria TaxID=860376 RepID=A0A9P1IGG7_9PELO|nr:unnamed protein product [Caenorhabditis angaria]
MSSFPSTSTANAEQQNTVILQRNAKNYSNNLNGEYGRKNYEKNEEKKEDYSNVPASIIIQIEKANRTIAAQNVEIDRLRNFPNSEDTKMLKRQIFELEKEMRGNRERFLEQQELLSEMSREMDNLLREKLKMQANLQEMEKKYRKAKYATKELARILENDSTKFVGICNDSENEEYEEDFGNETNMSNSLFHRSPERAIEQAEERKKNEILSKEREMMEKVLADNENLLIDLDRERQLSESLHNDLEKTRTMILDRDETILDLKSKLGKADELKNQAELDLSRTSTDLALERARCDALTLELHELDAIFAQTQSTVQAFAIENEQLDEKCREAHHTIISLNAKLEAQGNDLIQTKKQLRAIKEASTKT